jgi:hypothetical protein
MLEMDIALKRVGRRSPCDGARVTKESPFAHGCLLMLGLLAAAVAPSRAVLAEPEAPLLCDIQTQECDVGPQKSSSGIKWHPGHYMQVPRGDHETSQATRFGYYDKIGNNADVVGVMVPFRWSMLEGAEGDYSAGMATIRKEIAKLKSLPQPKRFYLRFIDFHYGSTNASSGYFPSYLGGKGTYVGSNGVGWCRWQTRWMDAYIRMMEAYAAEFDDEPYFEGFYLYRETAPALGGKQPCGFSLSAYESQTMRLATAMAAAWKKTNIVLSANFIGSQSVMNRIIAHNAELGVGVGGPDILPDSCARNGTQAYETITGASGGHDYRGEIPIQYSVEAAEMGGALANCSIDELRDFANGTLHASHLFWQRNTYTGTSAQQWPAILRYIADDGNALTHTSCPARYSQGCDAR